MRQVLGPGALGRPREMGWGGKWEGESGWGTHVNPWLIHVNVWQKPLQYCKVISLQLIKINGKKKKKKKNQCFQILALEKSLESPWDCKIKSVNPKANKLRIFIGRTVAEAEALIFWPPDAKSWYIGKDPDPGKYWREKGEGGGRWWDD